MLEFYDILLELSLLKYGRGRFGIELEMVAPFRERNSAFYQIREDLKDKYPDIGKWHAKADSTIERPQTIKVPIKPGKSSAINVISNYLAGVTDAEERIKALEIQAGLRIPANSMKCKVCSCIHKIQTETVGFTCHCGAKWSKEFGWEPYCYYR